MGLVEIILIAVSLAMDAFAVSICKGLSMKKMDWKKAIIIGLYFGIFQAGMPVIGYLLGVGFEESIKFIDHWIAFGLLAFIGGNMIKEALSKNEEDEVDDKVDFKTMVVLAIATSIDALAVGVTFAFLNVNIVLAVSLIGILTFIISCIGVKLGNVFGDKYEKKAELAGGIVLILIGLKILLEHLGILVL
ncbi:MAG: manganese efflux pump [Clostridia bacterium]|nr:manganese efflux pump [Clostridia bacterium]